MAVITLNKKALLQLVGKKLNDKELAEKISMLGVPVDAVLESEIEVDVSPNRPDWLCEQGLARSLGSFLGLKTGLRQYKVFREHYQVFVEKNVRQVRPYTVCAVVKGLNLDDEKIRELIQVQEKLHATFCRNRKKAAIGVYPLEKIAFPIRYTAKKPEEIVFVPLESTQAMTGAELLTQHPTGRAYAHLLAGKERFPVFIDAKGQVLSVPPIINSALVGKVEPGTKDVFVECSGFDLHTLKILLNILVTALADLGGRIVCVDVKYSKKITTPDLTPRKIRIDFDAINRLLGLDLKQGEIRYCLERMGYGVAGNVVLVPAWRADVLHQVDLAEDVAIAYGYDRIRPELPSISTVGSQEEFSKFQDVVGSVLVGIGMLEAQTFHLSNRNVQSRMMQHSIDVVELANALTVDYNVLRAWMLPSLMEVLKTNKMKEYPQKFFSMGTVFKQNVKTPTQVEERTILGIVSAHAKADYTEIRQVVEYLMRVLGLNYEIVEAEHPSFIPGRVAELKVDGRAIALFGEIHPQVLMNFSLEMPVAAAEVNLEEVFERVKTH